MTNPLIAVIVASSMPIKARRFTFLSELLLERHHSTTVLLLCLPEHYSLYLQIDPDEI